MKTEQPILITSVECAVESGAEKHTFIRFDGTIGAENIKSLGVCYANTEKGQMMPVMAKGIALVKTGAAISEGAAVQTFDDGLAVTQTAGPLEGYAMDTASGAGELIRILLS